MTTMNRKYPEKVYLHIYDLSPINKFLYLFGLGLYHSGLEVYGREYTFAGGAGIFDSKPKEVIEIEGVPLRETIVIGETMKSRKDIADIIHSLRDQYGGNDYNLITRNCNTFANSLCSRILGIDIPGYVNRLANFGRIFEPIIAFFVSLFIDQSQSQSQSKYSYQVNEEKQKFIPFGGQGNKLSY